MCHVAAWLIDGVNAPAHGPNFWKWAHQVETKIPSIRVTQCHSYEINVPYKFTCTNEGCQHIYSRHSKKGIDTSRSTEMPMTLTPPLPSMCSRHVCGLCQSPLQFSGAYNPDGTVALPSPHCSSPFRPFPPPGSQRKPGKQMNSGEPSSLPSLTRPASSSNRTISSSNNSLV
jgi:hypothetical protein